MMIEITTMKGRHVEEVAALEQISFSEPWSEQAFWDTLDNEEYIYLVALFEDKVVGYAGCVISLDEGSVTNIAVHKNYRKIGIGEELMLQLRKQLALRAVKQIFLEVRESNVAARILYRKCGYEEMGLRKNFYRKPDEHGIVMRLEISEADNA